MILADCHTHSLCSPDSEAPMPAMAQRATELGLTTLCLTDHCDLLSLEGERTLAYDWAAVEQERKKMLDAFGTKLEFTSTVGEGTTVALTLPKEVYAHEEADD